MQLSDVILSSSLSVLECSVGGAVSNESSGLYVTFLDDFVVSLKETRFAPLRETSDLRMEECCW